MYKFALFTNKEKTTASQPDMKGKAEINGVEYWASAWNNTSQAGLNYLSVTLKEKIKTENTIQPDKQTQKFNPEIPVLNENDYDLPF